SRTQRRGGARSLRASMRSADGATRPPCSRRSSTWSRASRCSRGASPSVSSSFRSAPSSPRCSRTSGTSRWAETGSRSSRTEASVEAARLAKADQAAELVREFPDLEGHIGAEYARMAGYPEAVCAAIDEQYLPDSGGGPLPQTEAGKVLAAADKLDTLSTSFS